jgi:hypothetical protein
MRSIGMKDDFILRISKLNTHEDYDYFHLHKILGILTLFHYFYRYYLLFFTGSFQINTKYDLNLLLLHGLLSSSSMIFNISRKRNMSSPMIYPEFRLHSIIFAYRSIICCYLHYYKFSNIYSILVCYTTMLGADLITNYFKKDDNSTMRNMPFPSTITLENKNKITFFNSSMQIGATIFMLNNIDTAFSPLCAIQIAAFLMTLVRKNIIKSVHWHFIYSLLLIINFFVFYNCNMSIILTDTLSVLLFKFLRFNNKYNKYLCWSIIFSLYTFALYKKYLLYIDEKIIKIPYSGFIKNSLISYVIYDYGHCVYKCLFVNNNIETEDFKKIQ